VSQLSHAQCYITGWQAPVSMSGRVVADDRHLWGTALGLCYCRLY